MSYNFGHSFTRQAFFLEGDEYINLPSQAPAIYLFDSMPNRDDALAGTGAFSTISYWTENTSTPFNRNYTIPPIADPSPSSSVRIRNYWEAINFIATTSGQTQTLIRSFDLERAQALPESPLSTAQELKDIYPAITNYLTDAQLLMFGQIAEDEMQIDFEAAGYDWGQLHSLKKARLCLAYKTIALASLSQFKEPDDRFHERYKIFSEKYSTMLKNIKLPVDTDDDGAADAEAEGDTGAIYVRR